MLTGVDTGFFFALEDQHPVAVNIWKEREIVTSAIVLYELQKKLLQGYFSKWPKIIEDIMIATILVPLSPEISLKAGSIAHETKIPGLDALIWHPFWKRTAGRFTPQMPILSCIIARR